VTWVRGDVATQLQFALPTLDLDMVYLQKIPRVKRKMFEPVRGNGKEYQ
jgi:hypothetical protein